MSHSDVRQPAVPVTLQVEPDVFIARIKQRTRPMFLGFRLGFWNRREVFLRLAPPTGVMAYLPGLWDFSSNILQVARREYVFTLPDRIGEPIVVRPVGGMSIRGLAILLHVLSLSFPIIGMFFIASGVGKLRETIAAALVEIGVGLGLASMYFIIRHLVPSMRHGDWDGLYAPHDERMRRLLADCAAADAR